MYVAHRIATKGARAGEVAQEGRLLVVSQPCYVAGTALVVRRTESGLKIKPRPVATWFGAITGALNRKQRMISRRQRV
jgi:hypothetical protein